MTPGIPIDLSGERLTGGLSRSRHKGEFGTVSACPVEQVPRAIASKPCVANPRARNQDLPRGRPTGDA